MKICVLCASPPHRYDAVGDACWCLAEELARESYVSLIVSGSNGGSCADNGSSVSLIPVSSGWGLRTMREVKKRIARLQPDVVLVHFVPQLYGWNGAKPGLALLLHMLNRGGFRIVTVAHEFNAPFGPSPKLIAWSLIHRLLLRIVVRASHQIVLTTASRCELIQQRFAKRKHSCRHIPIANTIPVVAVQRDKERQEYTRQFGISEDELVVTTFGTNLESVAPLYQKLFQMMIANGVQFRVVLIGKSGKRFRQFLSHDREVDARFLETGPIPGSSLSRILSVCDLYVAFFPDGASTHRTSLLAGMAHGVATISNRGPSTEPALESSDAVRLLDYPLTDTAARSILDLCRTHEQRARLGTQGREYHDKYHSWVQIGRDYLQLMTSALECN